MISKTLTHKKNHLPQGGFSYRFGMYRNYYSAICGSGILFKYPCSANILPVS